MEYLQMERGLYVGVIEQEEAAELSLRLCGVIWPFFTPPPFHFLCLRARQVNDFEKKKNKIRTYILEER